MDDDIKLLNQIYKNAESCQNYINKIMPKVKDENLKSLLEKHVFEYNKIYVSCENNLIKKSEKLKLNKNFNGTFNNIGLDISIMFNNKSKNIADILIKENNSAIHDITKNIVEYQGASTETKELANNLLNNERNNIEELQKFI